MEVKPGYKQTEVGMIPEDWKTIDLSRLCTLQRGFDITEATRIPGPVPVYSSSGISYFHSKAMVLPPGVVTGRKGLLGKVFLIDEPFWPHDTTLWVKDFRGNHPAYVALVLQSFHLERLDAATSVPTLNRNNLAGHFVAFPPTLAEQEAIAEALSDADALIESLEQLLTKKRQIKQGAMQELLTGRKRLPGFSGEWETKRIGALFESKAGGDFDPTRSSDVQNESHPYPIYANSLSQQGIYGFCNSAENRAGSITVTARGTLGKAFYRHTPFVAIGRLLVLEPRVSMDARFFSEYINYGVHFAVESTGVPQLTVPQVASYSVPVPPESEQRTIATILSDMDAEIEALETKLTKARQIKQGMMQELLTGRVRLI